MNTEQFDGHTPGPWTLNDIEGRQIWKCLFNGECFTDPSAYGRPGYEEVLIATMAPLPPEDDPLAEAAFERMMADKMLMAAAPELLAEVKRLRAALSTCLWHAETDGTSFGSDFPLHDIIEVCNWALNEGDEEE